jgi:hypothetical protein
MIKMIALGTITEIIVSFVFEFSQSPVKQIPCFFDLIPNFGEIYESKGGSMLFYEMFQGNPVKGKIPVPQVKSLLGEIITLLDEVEVGVFHLCEIRFSKD